MTEDEHVRETYAHYGLALYLAQVLEHGLVNALIVARLADRRNVARVEIDAFMGQQFKRTLGQLVRELAMHVHVPVELESRLDQALSKRNWLAHSFFRERATDFVTSTGRGSMIMDCQAAQELFQQADQELSKLLHPIREKHGITDRAIATTYEELLRDNGLAG